MTVSTRFIEATRGKDLAYIRGVRTLCGPDCDPKEGYHVPDFERCQRCGSLIHKRLIDISHPTFGDVTVGSECVKEVLGWKWTKSHEQALETQQAIDSRLSEQGTAWTEVSKFSARQLMNEHLRHQGLGLGLARRYCSIELPYGWVDRLWRAALDLQLPWLTKADPYDAPVRGQWDAIGMSNADPNAFNWTAVLPTRGRELMSGGQSDSLEQARERLREELSRLLRTSKDLGSDYAPRGCIWDGPRRLVERCKMNLFGTLVYSERGLVL